MLKRGDRERERVRGEMEGEEEGDWAGRHTQIVYFRIA